MIWYISHLFHYLTITDFHSHFYLLIINISTYLHFFSRFTCNAYNFSLPKPTPFYVYDNPFFSYNLGVWASLRSIIYTRAYILYICIHIDKNRLTRFNTGLYEQKLVVLVHCVPNKPQKSTLSICLPVNYVDQYCSRSTPPMGDLWGIPFLLLAAL